MHNYAADHGSLPPAATYAADGVPLLSWRVALLPYVNGQELYKQFKLDEPWDSAHNATLLPKMPSVFEHFHGRAAPNLHSTYYQVFVGPGAAFEGPLGVSFKDFPDGTSNTLLIVEAAEAVPWTKPAELEYRAESPLPKLGGHWKEGFIAALADGSTRLVSSKLTDGQLRGAITRNGKEEVTELWR